MMWGAISPIAKGVLEEGVFDGLSLSEVKIGGIFFYESETSTSRGPHRQVRLRYETNIEI